MPEDRTVLTADGTQYFDVLSRAGVAADRLAGSGSRVGDGFVRGERVIRTASQNISAALLSSGDAASTALIAMSGLERVFRIGIGPTIAVAAGIKAFEFLHEQVKKTNDAYKDLKQELEKAPNIDPAVDEATKKIEELTKKIKALQDQMNKPTVKASTMFAGLGAILANAFLPRALSGPIGAGLVSGLAPGASPASANAIIQQANAKIADIANRREALFYQSLDRLSAAIKKTADNFLEGPRNLLKDIGSGEFMKDFFKNQTEQSQVQRGQQIADEIADMLSKGQALDPILQKEAEALGLVGGAKGFSIRDLARLDFSNINELSKYDFNGLAPLSGLTVIVK